MASSVYDINNNDSKKPLHIHILGIAGTFMANLAVIAKQLGYKVSGSDKNVYPPMSNLLDEENIEYITNYELEQNKIYLDTCDCIVIGNALSRGNPCVEYALDSKKLFKSGPNWLAENVLQTKWVLAVSGTHGKTTTTSMLASVLELCNLNPGFLIGGKANNFKDYARVTDGKYFVIEADEYDTAFFDKRPKFLHYLPNTLIINNIEFDHADIYTDLAAIEQQFGYLLRTVPSQNGTVIAPLELYQKFNTDSEIIKKFGTAAKLNIKYFHVLNNVNNSNIADIISNSKYKDVLIADIKREDCSKFDCYLNGELQGTVNWNCMGLHNINNALATILAAQSIGVELTISINVLSNFKGVARRLEKKAEFLNGIVVYDDFAHHPTAINTTLNGLKRHYIDNNLTVVVDFSSYTMRSGCFNQQNLVKALEYADSIYLYQAEYINFDLSKVLDLLNDNFNNKNIYLFKSQEDLISHMADNTKDNTTIVFMTKSAFNKNIKLLVDSINTQSELKSA